ncbi:Tripeptidyl-peptidase sed3 [Grifola frondosa]|uniref:tripeptidyl-peptidase II n=1 Tax=Grifola frondosa TaxID=5627 RepID=A0A1C7LRQ4_GRIFR|nr:Tripeptidyl-peptidase sed3 [Grifola frondosa]
MVSVGLLVVYLIPFALGKPMSRSMQMHEARETIPEGFTLSGPAPSETTLNMRLALVQSDPAGLEKALYDVSIPSSALYGQHLTKEEVEKFVAPTQESVDAVNAWLKENDITATTISPAGDWLSFSIPVSKASELLDADFSVFTHEETGQTSIRTLAYSIPTDLIGHVDLVHPTITFPNPFARLPVISSPSEVKPAVNLSSEAVPASCASTITPTCLQDLYGIPATKATTTTNKLGVSGFIEQFANQADLTTFLTNFRPDLPSTTTFALQTLDGGENLQSPSDAGVEANLDIQFTVGVASGVPTTFISVGEQFQDGALEGFLDIINFLLGETSPPQVLTTSYGQNENTISRTLANNLCNAYAQLGARGTSILFASGDGGVAGSQTTRCTTFLPTFPSGCPFMTSVGATTGISPETAASFSSGGFSNYFATPSYQTSVVSSYLTSLGSTNSGKFNRSGRAFPDVSAQGENVEIVVGGEFGLVAGTSCSSPIFASVVSLLNDGLIAAGKSPLGFLNPFLYSTGASALTDITTGDNPGCNTNGFPAGTGWDPVTGLGTPNFAKLKTAVGFKSQSRNNNDYSLTGTLENTTNQVSHSLNAHLALPLSNPKLLSLYRQQTSISQSVHLSEQNIRQTVDSLRKRVGITYGEDIPLDRNRITEWCLERLQAWGTSAGMESFKEDESGGRIPMVLGGKVLVMDIEFSVNRTVPEKPVLDVTRLKRSFAISNGTAGSTTDGSVSLDGFLAERLRAFLKQVHREPDVQDSVEAARLGALGEGDGGLRWFNDIDHLAVDIETFATREADAIARSLSVPRAPLDIFLARSHGLPLPYLATPTISFLVYLSPLVYLSLLRNSSSATTPTNAAVHLPKLDIPLHQLRTRPTFNLVPDGINIDHTFPRPPGLQAPNGVIYTWVLDFTEGGKYPGVVMSQSRMREIELVVNPFSGMDHIGDVPMMSFGTGSWLDLLLNPHNPISPERYTAIYTSPTSAHPDLQLRLTAPEEPGFMLEKVPIVREQCWLNEVLTGCQWTPEGLFGGLLDEEMEDADVTEDDLQAILKGTLTPRKIPVNVYLPIHMPSDTLFDPTDLDSISLASTAPRVAHGFL